VWIARQLRARSRRRLALNAASLLTAAFVVALVARHVALHGFPLARANPQLAAAAGVLFLLAYALKAFGWQRLFITHERPRSLTLAAASGAACVGGAALPGRVDDAIRIAVVRRFSGGQAGVSTLCLSLFMLGLVDTVALAPFASAAAATGGVPMPLRIGLAVVAAAGLGAALVMLALPRLTGSARLARFRVAGWLAARTTCAHDAWKATVLVALSWLVRAGALVLVLGALGVGLSVPLAVLFLCAAAASGALPVTPAGAATQAGAGAAVLVAGGLTTTQAIGVALAAQTLVMLAGAAVCVFAVAWTGGSRLARGRLSTV
jgi:hypothetical protein